MYCVFFYIICFFQCGSNKVKFVFIVNYFVGLGYMICGNGFI